MDHRKSHFLGFCLCLSFLVCVVGAAAPAVEIRSARQNQIAKQRQGNKEWKKAAEKREAKLYDEAERYYRMKKYAKAAGYYHRMLEVRYRQWKFRKVGRSATLEPALKKTKHKLDTSCTRTARTRLATIPDKVKGEKAKQTKQKIAAYYDKAEVAMMLDDEIKAYDIYGDLIRYAESRRQDKHNVSAKLKAIKKRKELIANISKPLIEAERLIKSGKAANARKILDDFERKYRRAFKAMPELAKHLAKLTKTPEIVAEDREHTAQRKLLAGDTAFVRKDYVVAENHYRNAAMLYTNTTAGKIAAGKLAQMLSDPVIVAAQKKQRITQECKTQIERARYLVQLGKPKKAREICNNLIAIYPDTEWAARAQEILKTTKE